MVYKMLGCAIRKLMEEVANEIAEVAPSTTTYHAKPTSRCRIPHTHCSKTTKHKTPIDMPKMFT